MSKVEWNTNFSDGVQENQQPKGWSQKTQRENCAFKHIWTLMGHAKAYEVVVKAKLKTVLGAKVNIQDGARISVNTSRYVCVKWLRVDPNVKNWRPGKEN